MEYKVGQILWFVPEPNGWMGEPRHLIIQKVGRKWLECDGLYNGIKLSKTDLVAHNRDHSCLGIAYIDQQAYNDYMFLVAAKNKLRQRIYAYRLTRKQIDAINKILDEE